MLLEKPFSKKKLFFIVELYFSNIFVVAKNTNKKQQM